MCIILRLQDLDQNQWVRFKNLDPDQWVRLKDLEQISGLT